MSVRVSRPPKLTDTYVIEAVAKYIKKLYSLQTDDYEFRVYLPLPESNDETTGYFFITGIHKVSERGLYLNIHCKLNKKSMTMTDMGNGVSLR